MSIRAETMIQIPTINETEEEREEGGISRATEAGGRPTGHEASRKRPHQ